MKSSLSLEHQVGRLAERKLDIADVTECLRFLAANNYYRFSGYARYFQVSPQQGQDDFRPGTSFSRIREVYEADEALRNTLVNSLARVEILLRAHTAYAIAQTYGPYDHYLDEGFYTDVGNAEPTVESCLRDIARSKERHILRFQNPDDAGPSFTGLPVWSAIDVWSFGTLSKCIERGANGDLADKVAASIGVAKAGFPYRVRALVYLRNRCAHHSRLWHHSVIDAGPTPNNVRTKAKKLAGQFEPRSVLDIVASLDDLLSRAVGTVAILPRLAQEHSRDSLFWTGLSHPTNPIDNQN